MADMSRCLKCGKGKVTKGGGLGWNKCKNCGVDFASAEYRNLEDSISGSARFRSGLVSYCLKFLFCVLVSGAAGYGVWYVSSWLLKILLGVVVAFFALLAILNLADTSAFKKKPWE